MTIDDRTEITTIDKPDLILSMLRNIEIKLNRLVDDVGDLKARMTAAERAAADMDQRIYRIDQRLDRIERSI